MRHRGVRAGVLASAALLGAVALSPTSPAGAAAGVTEVGLPIPDVTPAGLTAGPSGSVWFAENAGGLGKVDSAGKVTEYPLPANSQKTFGAADAMAAGPGGRLWFTDSSVDVPRVGYVDPATGKTTLFEVPTTTDVNFAGGRLTDIVAGPDGAMWFGGVSATAIGRIDASGTVTAYATAGAAVYGLAAGPDGAIWYTGTDGSIGRLDPKTGAVTAYYPASAGSGSPTLGGIVKGPDGALWFTEPGVGKIGRLDPATGNIVEYPVNTADSAPSGITVGPDGLIWFTEAAASNVGSIDPGSGAVSEYPLPATLSAPMRITSGPGGRLWFSESGRGAVGSFDPASPPAGSPHPAVPPLASGSTPRIAAKFQSQCPQNTTCQSQVTSGGSVKIGSFALDLPPNAIRVTGYITSLSPGSVLHAPVMGEQLLSQPVEVPGGLIGQLPLIGPILGKTPAAMLPFNRLTVTQSLAAPITVQLGQGGIQATAQLNVHLNNQLLGSNCVIGPITTSLTPTVLVPGGAGDPSLGWSPYPIQINNKIAVPAAKGCGPASILDGVINQMMGLPSSSANNAMNLVGVMSLGAGINPADTPALRSTTSTSVLSKLVAGLRPQPKAKTGAKKHVKAPKKVTVKVKARH
ncbi:Vgb family protein [Actinoallomurus sp. CA-150999]|uniref:Vgb family protein n=1 Tax=Actinoallomurus sp. CA-150999 TaxID=3239887 RepID=UPI003D8F313F